MPDESAFPDRALGVRATLEPERGRWVVYLDVSFWNEGSEDQPIKTVRRRIETYATKERAELAASFMVRAAAREQAHPPLGL